MSRAIRRVSVAVGVTVLAVFTMAGDVSDPALADALVAETQTRFGGVDVLANVAGILHTANTHEHDLDMWMRVLNINIDDIKTRAAQNGHFELELRLSVPRETPVTMLRDYLQHLCGEMQVQWNLDPA